MQPTRFPGTTSRPSGTAAGGGYTTTHHPSSHNMRPASTQHPSSMNASSALVGSNLPSSTTSAASSSTSASASSSSSSSAQPNTRGIELGGWKISVTSGPIGSSAEMDALGEILGIPPPEMAFPHNCLSLHHSESGFSLCFDAVRTLRSVDGVRELNRLHGINCKDPSSTSSTSASNTKKSSSLKSKPKPKPKSSIKVAYAKEWGKSRNEYPTAPPPASASGGADESMSNANTNTNTTSHFGADVAKKVFAQQQQVGGVDTTDSAAAATTSGIAAAKDYDWTYSTTWAGSVGETAPQPLLSDTPSSVATTTSSSSSSSGSTTRQWFVPGTDPSRDRIPVERLGPSSGEPILFYDDIVLFEDELADNGSSMVNVKVRVMPSGFLVLQRFFLRVDDVLFRVFDTRLYCQFPESQRPGSSVPRSIPSRAGMPNAQRTTQTVVDASQFPTNLSNLSLGATRSALKRGAGSQTEAAPASNDTDVEMSSETSTSTRSQPGTGMDHEPWSDSDSDSATSYPRLIRECSGNEASYTQVRKHLPAYKPNDLSPLTDVQWVSTILTKISQSKATEYHAAIASGARLPLLDGLHVKTPPKFDPRTSGTSGGVQGTQRGAFGFAGNRPGERVDLSPAKLFPSNDTQSTTSSAQILGELPPHHDQDEEEVDDDTWIGIGARVDVAVLRPQS